MAHINILKPLQGFNNKLCKSKPLYNQKQTINRYVNSFHFLYNSEIKHEVTEISQHIINTPTRWETDPPFMW